MPYSVQVHGIDFIREQAAARQRTYRAKKYAENPDFYREQKMLQDPKHAKAAVARARARQEHVKRATPPWADTKIIQEFYENCPDGFHVDHQIPLRGDLVSGLHVRDNLQYLTDIENIAKGNKWEPEDWVLFDRRRSPR